MSQQKVCIVTGASRGIGRGIALVLARDEGCIVYTTARSVESLAALVDQVAKESKGGGKIIPCAVDHTNDAVVKAFVDKVLSEQTGRLDLLVNNAYGGVEGIGENFGKMFWERPLNSWDASHSVGLRSHYIMTALVAPSMVEKRSGLIVNISSAGGMQYLFDVPYGCGKACLDRLGADMAVELRPHGVHCITLWPGAVNTETTQFPNAESVEFSGRGIGALLNKATPEDIDGFTGKIVQTVELAEKYGYKDINGQLSGKDQADMVRKALSSVPPIQWNLKAKLPNTATNSEAMKEAFNASGKRASKL